MAPNQSFRGIVSFQDLSRRFVSLFSHFLLAPISLPLLFKCDLIIIATNSEKGKPLSGSGAILTADARFRHLAERGEFARDRTVLIPAMPCSSASASGTGGRR